MKSSTENVDIPGMGEAQTCEQLSADETTCAELHAWLDAFAAAIRDVDYSAGEKLFAPEVVGFGTVGVLLTGRDELMTSQWKRVWGVTSGFQFDLARLTGSATAEMAWLAVPWMSYTRPTNGTPRGRYGRATYVLERRDKRWLAVHSHHSLDPSGVPPAS